MDWAEHLVVALCLVVVLIIYIPHILPMSDKEMLSLFIPFIVFSSILTPDIDTKIPYLGHRTLTHKAIGIIVLAGVGWLVSNTALSYIGQPSYSAFTPFIWFGMVLGWYVHIGTDFVYDRMRQMTWGVIALILLAAWWFAK